MGARVQGTDLTRVSKSDQEPTAAAGRVKGLRVATKVGFQGETPLPTHLCLPTSDFHLPSSPSRPTSFSLLQLFFDISKPLSWFPFEAPG